MSAPLTLNTSASHLTSSSATMEPPAPGLLAKATYDQLRESGLSDVDIMAFAGELLSLVASGVSRQPSQS